MGLEPTTELPHLFSRQAPGHRPKVGRGRITSVSKAAGVGVEPTSRRSECLVLPLDDPAVIDLRELGEKDLNLHNLVQSQAAYR